VKEEGGELGDIHSNIKEIFITGASGFIGGTIFTELLKSPEKYTVSALVRREEQAEIIRKLGATPIVGSLDDAELLFNASREADVVINTADSDHFSAARAIVKGLKAKKDKNAILIHTSGTSVISFTPTTTTPFSDEDIARIHAIPTTVIHKDVDDFILHNSEDFKAVIICPSCINGIGTGPFNKTSVQVSNLAKLSVKRRKAGWFDRGHEVIWNNVHVRDLADLYILVLDGLLNGTIDKYGKEAGFYFGATGEHSWKKVAEALGTILHKHGLVDTPEASPFDKEFVDKYGAFALPPFGRDSRGVADRGKRLGWKPHRPDVFQSMEEEVEYIINNKDIFKYDEFIANLTDTSPFIARYPSSYVN